MSSKSTVAKNQTNGSPAKGAVRAILLMSAGVATIAAVAFVATLLLMPSKQEYKQLADAQKILQASYGEYLKLGSQRDFLEFSARVSSFRDVVGGSGASTQAAPELLVNQPQLEEIEQNERDIARKIVENEQYMEELVADFSDREIVGLYDDYKTQRQAIYGENSGFEDLAGSVIGVYRFLYKCQAFVETGSLWDIDEARAALSYGRGCERLAEELVSSDTLIERHKQPTLAFQQAIQARVDLLEPMVASDSFDYNEYEQLHDSQEAGLLNGISDRNKLIPITEIHSSLNDNLGGAVTRKQNWALGRIEDF